MKRLMYLLIRMLGILLILLLILITGSYINHRVTSGKEKAFLIPMGERVQVDGGYLNVLTGGEADRTLIFMSGGGTPSPILDFKAIYSEIQNSYRYAVVEKSGYGFSDVIDKDRDVDTTLEDTRKALKAAGLDGPYVLVPHSMSGIEALRWAQKYPEEVTAIIGLDMAVPEAYQELKISEGTLKAVSFLNSMGITRLFSQAEKTDVMRQGLLSDEEKKTYRALYYRNTMNPPMIAEVLNAKDNSLLVDKEGLPELPVLMFISNGEGTGFSKDRWQTLEKNAAFIMGAETVMLDAPHYIHDFEYRKIAEKIRDWLR